MLGKSKAPLKTIKDATSHVEFKYGTLELPGNVINMKVFQMQNNFNFKHNDESVVNIMDSSTITDIPSPRQCLPK
jgi:hypothetical protein